MLNQSDKIERFTEVINKTAEKQCKKIKKQTEEFKNKELSELMLQSESELKKQIEFDVGRIARNTNGQISAFQSESKKKIAAVRDEIKDSVFEKAAGQLLEFSKTEQYGSFLQKSIVSLCDEIGSNAVIYVKSADEEKAKEIAKSISNEAQVKVSDEIKIGGAYASNPEETVFAYDTFETRLQSQVEPFMASSGLIIV